MLAAVTRPVVAILATGDELVEPFRPPHGRADRGVEYLRPCRNDRSRRAAKPRHIGIARDDAEDLAQKFAEANGADILVTTGGASVGDHDLVRPALEAAGATLDFYKIAMRPGKPMFFGKLGGMRVLGLPGNPLSAMIGARVFLVPYRQDAGPARSVEAVAARLAVALPANGPRDHYMRATLDVGAMPPRATPLDTQDSAFVTGLTRADCLLVIPANSAALAAGADVFVLLLDF